jgi:uncharacterized membrane protein
MDSWLLDLTRAGALIAAFMAGFFFAYSNGVMPALRRLPADQGAVAMQTINRDVQNPLFLVVFVGAAILGAAIVVSAAWTWDQSAAGLRLGGGALLFVGSFVLTVVYHVPRNDSLDRSVAYWPTYLTEWIPANHARTVACAAAAFVLGAAVRA